jgi:GH15 family glucan-1,4-alpha-glucosidase
MSVRGQGSADCPNPDRSTHPRSATPQPGTPSSCSARRPSTESKEDGHLRAGQRRPDAGIWELDNRPWTHSRLTAAAGLRAIAGVAPASTPIGDWLALADKITAETTASSLHPDGHWQRSPDDERLDAALLIPGLRGAIPADDPRTTTTLRAYLRELTGDGYAYRFRHSPRPLYEAEGSFLLCGFLTALALHHHGEPVEARAWYERTHSACGPAQLFSEEYDPHQHQMRGNVPQAFVHALAVEAAAALTGDLSSMPE